MAQHRGLSFAAAAPAVVIVFFSSVAPLAWMLGVVVLHPEVRRELLLTRFRAELLIRTLGFNGAAALLAAAMGLPAGIVLGRGRGTAARMMWALLPAALLLPSLAYAYGWKQFVRVTFGDPVPASFWDIARCVWSLAAWLWAVPAVLIGLSLRRMDSSVQQQAALDGALWRVTLRQLVGPIIASIAVVTLLASQEFAVYEPSGISVTATEVRMVFDTGSLSSPDNSIAGAVPQGEGFHSTNQASRAAAAVATAAPMLLITVVLAGVAAYGARRTIGSDTVATGSWPPLLDAPRWVMAVTVVLLLVNILTPVGALLGSLHRAPDPVRMSMEFGPQLGGAIELAILAAAAACVASFSAAARWTRGLIAVAGASFLIGGQILAIALIRIFNHAWLDWLYDSPALTVMAYLGRFGWLALAGGRASWSRPWRDLREMASVDGADAPGVAFHVVWPLAWPTLLAGGLLVGALSMTEVPATVLLMPMNPQVLTPTMMTWVHAQRSDPMIEAALLMMGSVLLPTMAAVALTALGLRFTRSRLAENTTAPPVVLPSRFETVQ